MPRSVLLHPRDTADPASNIIRRADDRTAIINPTGTEPVGFFVSRHVGTPYRRRYGVSSFRTVKHYCHEAYTTASMGFAYCVRRRGCIYCAVECRVSHGRDNSSKCVPHSKGYDFGTGDRDTRSAKLFVPACGLSMGRHKWIGHGSLSRRRRKKENVQSESSHFLGTSQTLIWSVARIA